jgi:protein N-terminal methyltransferase
MENAEAPPDSHIDPAASIKYWNSVSPSVNGMLGGFPKISRIDLRGSASFLAKLRRLSSASSNAASGSKLKLGVDCGAGIGRVTEGFLSNVCEVVDIVEPVESFAKVVGEGKLKQDGRVGDIYTVGLEAWEPSKSYDLIWNQWCVGHLTDSQLVEYLRRCKEAVDSKGWIVVKENLSTDMDGEDIYDDVDSSVTRSDAKFHDLFQLAGLKVVKEEIQAGFSRRLGLYPVKLYALRPWMT